MTTVKEIVLDAIDLHKDFIDKITDEDEIRMLRNIEFALFTVAQPAFIIESSNMRVALKLIEHRLEQLDVFIKEIEDEKDKETPDDGFQNLDRYMRGFYESSLIKMESEKGFLMRLSEHLKFKI